jgi:hypothetical protein
MDPDESLKTIIDGLVKAKNLEALEALQNLMDWLNRDGGMPLLDPIELAISRLEKKLAKTG